MNDAARTFPAAAIATTHPSHWPALAARSLIALLFIVSGIQKAVTFEAVVGWMASEGVPLAPLALAATLAIELVSGAALLFGLGQRLAAWVLAGFVVAATLAFHAFWLVPAEQFADQLTHFLKNGAIVGGLLLIARGDRGDR